jgi:plastocyanin
LRKKIISIGAISALILALAAIAVLNTELESQSSDSESKIQSHEVVLDADVIMPNKVSRPGCEITDSCYVPSTITVKKGEKVTWLNDDVAFHSITSGLYDNPSDLFDSGHLDPGEKFSITFEDKGVFDYFCTLHPWMDGQVVVE